jgi:predicted alpha/beta hydrolase
VEALMGWYSRADVRLRWFTMEDTHDRPVGHFGFFRIEHKQTLWPQISDWLIREQEPDMSP